MGLAWLLVGLTAGCGTDEHAAAPALNASAIVLCLAPEMGQPQRPAVVFSHDRHVEALTAEGCGVCHALVEGGRVRPQLEGTTVFTDEDELSDFFHATCLGCHRRRRLNGHKTGPELCGGCHQAPPDAASVRREIRLDASLHHRHSRALDDKCETCHHLYDEKAQKLVYQKDSESNCRDCHGEQDAGKTPSWTNAAHVGCINCHLRAQQKARERPSGQAVPVGPVDCAGCHDPARQAAIEKVAAVPRLKRKLPDRIWVHSQGATANLVPFDHQAHEPLGAFCSSCHHRTLQPCATCHPLGGSDRGGGVTLAQAQHHPTVAFACLGCHREQAARAECAGCHDQRMRPPGESTCRVCHAGPAPARENAAEPPAELFAQVQLAALPEASAELFPESLVLDTLGTHYQPTSFPHLKIARKLDELSRTSKLANRFHGQVETLCAGCHHHTPVGQRPPACQSCHPQSGQPQSGQTMIAQLAPAGSTQDLPELRTAYHRQCIGCHQRMGLAQQGCEDCHRKAEKGVRP